MRAFNDELVAALPRLGRFARGLTGNAIDTDDLVQAACERALSRQHQFTPGTRFDSWMFRIVQTIWIDRCRSKKIHSTRWLDDPKLECHLGSDRSKRHIAARLALDDVWRALEDLPQDQQAMVRLVCILELSYKEAARIAGTPVGTVMSRLARARERLAGMYPEAA